MSILSEFLVPALAAGAIAALLTLLGASRTRQMSIRSEVLVLALAAGTIAALLTLLVLDIEPGPAFFWWFLTFGSAAAGGMFLGIAFLQKYPVRDVDAEPEATLAYVANRLRSSGYRVSDSLGKLTVRIGPFSALLVEARRTPSGCRVQYQPFATPAGWGALLMALIFVLPGPTGLGLAAYGFLRAWSFALNMLAPLLPAQGKLPETVAEDRKRSMLVDALSEAHRAAAEAAEALRSNYLNFQSVVGGGSVVVWHGVFIMLFARDLNPVFTARALWALGGAAAVIAAAAIPFAVLVRSRLRPRILEYRGQADKLRLAMERAAAPAVPEADEPSAFETLMDAAVEVPSWIEVSRRRRLSRDPAGFLILIAAVWTITFVTVAVSFLFFDLLLAAILGLVGVALSASATRFYRRWRRRWDEETRTALQAWKSRIEDAKAQMSRYLEGL